MKATPRSVRSVHDTTYWVVAWNQYEPSPHGTTARYRAGCDCHACLGAEADYKAKRDGRERLLAMECACGRRDVKVPAEDVRRGVEHLCAACRRNISRRKKAA